MTQKAKKMLMAVMMALMVVPVFTVYAAPEGLSVCGDPAKEEAAVQELYNLRRNAPPYSTMTKEAGDKAYNDALQAALAKFEASSCKLSNVFDQIAKITNFLIGFVGVLAVFMLVNAGFNLVTAVGNESKIKEAKEGITNAILGVIIVLIAFAVANTLFQLFQVRVMGTPNVSFPLNLFK